MLFSIVVVLNTNFFSVCSTHFLCLNIGKAVYLMRDVVMILYPDKAFKLPVGQ